MRRDSQRETTAFYYVMMITFLKLLINKKIQNNYPTDFVAVFLIDRVIKEKG
jgi:hypothetical protein